MNLYPCRVFDVSVRTRMTTIVASALRTSLGSFQKWDTWWMASSVEFERRRVYLFRIDVVSRAHVSCRDAPPRTPRVSACTCSRTSRCRPRARRGLRRPSRSPYSPLVFRADGGPAGTETAADGAADLGRRLGANLGARDTRGGERGGARAGVRAPRGRAPRRQNLLGIFAKRLESAVY